MSDLEDVKSKEKFEDDPVEDNGEKRKRKRKRKKDKTVDNPAEGASEGSSEKQQKVDKPKDRTGQDTKKGTAGKDADPGPQDGVYANKRTVYIEGVPFDASEDDVRAFFSSCGKIASLRMPKWHDTGRLRGYGHVEFDDDESAAKAKELDGNYMGKRFIAVTDSQTPRAMRLASAGDAVKKRPPGCKTIFVKNLPYECEEKDVREAMMVCGPIDKVRLAVWGHTGKLKGFGYVDFKREESAEVAVKKNGAMKILGRAVICDYEGGSAKASFRG